jgi:hypothetical protein
MPCRVSSASTVDTARRLDAGVEVRAVSLSPMLKEPEEARRAPAEVLAGAVVFAA